MASNRGESVVKSSAFSSGAGPERGGGCRPDLDGRCPVPPTGGLWASAERVVGHRVEGSMEGQARRCDSRRPTAGCDKGVPINLTSGPWPAIL